MRPAMLAAVVDSLVPSQPMSLVPLTEIAPDTREAAAARMRTCRTFHSLLAARTHLLALRVAAMI